MQEILRHGGRFVLEFISWYHACTRPHQKLISGQVVFRYRWLRYYCLFGITLHLWFWKGLWKRKFRDNLFPNKTSFWFCRTLLFGPELGKTEIEYISGIFFFPTRCHLKLDLAPVFAPQKISVYKRCLIARTLGLWLECRYRVSRLFSLMRSDNASGQLQYQAVKNLDPFWKAHQPWVDKPKLFQLSLLPSKAQGCKDHYGWKQA